MDPRKINIKNVKDYQMTVEDCQKQLKTVLNKTRTDKSDCFCKTYNFEQYTKKLIFGPKINKNGENRQNKNFTTNGIWRSLYPLMPFNFMQYIKKSNEPILSKSR